MSGGETIMENEGLKGKKRRGRQKVLNKAAKIVLKKARYEIGDSSSHIVGKPSPEQVHEKRRFKVPETAKNLCLVYQVMPSSFQICKEVKKPCGGRGPG